MAFRWARSNGVLLELITIADVRPAGGSFHSSGSLPEGGTSGAHKLLSISLFQAGLWNRAGSPILGTPTGWVGPRTPPGACFPRATIAWTPGRARPMPVPPGNCTGAGGRTDQFLRACEQARCRTRTFRRDPAHGTRRSQGTAPGSGSKPRFAGAQPASLLGQQGHTVLKWDLAEPATQVAALPDICTSRRTWTCPRNLRHRDGRDSLFSTWTPIRPNLRAYQNASGGHGALDRMGSSAEQYSQQPSGGTGRTWQVHTGFPKAAWTNHTGFF